MKQLDRFMIGAVAALGLALSGLTVWSLKQQSDALGERDLDILKDAAVIAAEERRTRLRDELEDHFEAAGRAWERGRVAAVQEWGRTLTDWELLHFDTRDATWSRYPLALFERLFPRAEAGRARAAIEFSTALEPDQRVRVVALGRIAPAAHVALAADAGQLLRRYWPPADGKLAVRPILPAGVSRTALRDAGDAAPATQPGQGLTSAADGYGPVLATLGPEFAQAVLIPTEQAAGRLAGQDQRRRLYLLVISLALLSAWGVVTWLLARVLRSQRELVRLQSRFVADVSHELKTPLALIRLLSETLLEDRIRDPARLRSYYETISRESERLTTLIDSILDFSRLESGKRRIELVECDVGEVARLAWALFEPQFAREGFDAQLEIAPELPLVKADPQALQQVFINLLQNAQRYSGDRKFVRMTVNTEGFLMVITVTDHGIGMSPDQLERLGDSFYRAEDTQVRRTRGTGLGLAIVSHIIAAHRGKLEVHSRPSQGSKFTIWFPYEPAADARTRSRAARPA